ncbi:MAG: glutaminase [Solirubrobacteraceae bacterium]|jgi:glutaminase|nr:glutaminase [Solirubrobacteraceae bacterium]
MTDARLGGEQLGEGRIAPLAESAPGRAGIVAPHPPDATDYPELLEQVMAAVAPSIGEGRVPDYIPALAAGDPGRFGLAVATVDGELHGVGDWREEFSVQSISKVFALATVVALDAPGIWARVGREPSGDPFNSLVQLEYDRGVPRNPFVNAGALVVTDHLLTLTGDASGAVSELARDQSENVEIWSDPRVAASEAEHSHRNAALAHLIASFGNLHNEVDIVLDHYFRQCALQMSCADLAVAAGFLARHGVGRGGSRVLSRSNAKRVNAVMLTCGTYDRAGEFAYRVGLPGKSGVGGGVLAVIPGRCTVCAWSPGLDDAGNSIAAVAALDALTTLTGWSVF